MTLAGYLRLMREKRGASVAWLSRASGVAERSLRYWESGEHEPRLQELTSVLQALVATAAEQEHALSLLRSPQKQRAVRRGRVSEVNHLGARMDSGDLLGALRLRRGKSVAEVADGLKISQTTLSRWEASKVLPSEDNVVRLSALLQAHPQEQEVLLQARRRGLLGADTSLTLAGAEAGLASFKERLDAYDDSPGGNHLIELEAVCLASALWDLARRDARAELFLAQVYTALAPWLVRRGRRGEGLAYANRALPIMHRAPGQQSDFWLGALVAAYQVYMARDSERGRKQARNLLTRWQPLLTAPELQVNCYILLADNASKQNQKEEAAFFLRHGREAMSHLEEARSRYTEARLEAIRIEMGDDIQLTQAYTLARAGFLHDVFKLLPPADAGQWPGRSLTYLLVWAEVLLLAGDKSEAHSHIQRAYECIAKHDLNLWRNRVDELAEKL